MTFRVMIALVSTIICAASDCNLPICMIEEFKWPTYPILARQAGLEGRVRVVLSVEGASMPVAVVSIEGDELFFYKAVLESLKGRRSYRYCAAKRIIIEYHFRLRADEQPPGYRNLYEPSNKIIVEEVRLRPIVH